MAARAELEKQLLEKQVVELRAQLNQDATRSEMGELKRSLERKEKEKMELSAHIEVSPLGSGEWEGNLFVSSWKYILKF